MSLDLTVSRRPQNVSMRNLIPLHSFDLHSWCHWRHPCMSHPRIPIFLWLSLKIQIRSLSSCFFFFQSYLVLRDITSLGEERAGLCASRAFVCLFCTGQSLSFFSSSWCQGLAATCDCGAPWTFLLTFMAQQERFDVLHNELQGN